MKVIQAGDGVISLGRQGENLARQIRFDLSCWIKLYGNGIAQMLAQRPEEETLYPVPLYMDGNNAVWVITSADTEIAGRYGRCELRYYVGDVLAKSEVWYTIVEPALETGEGAGNEPAQDWVSQVLQAGVDAQEAAQRAETAAIRQPIIQDGTWWTWDPKTGEYQDTGTPASGSGGASYKIGHGLKVEENTLLVDIVSDFEGDNTLPIAAAAVQETVGNIEILLGTI